MTLELLDKSIKHLYGIAEDVIAKVNKFSFLNGFMVTDIEESDKVSLVLDWPVMKTAERWLTSMQDEDASLDLFEAIKHSKDKDTSFKMDVYMMTF